MVAASGWDAEDIDREQAADHAREADLDLHYGDNPEPAQADESAPPEKEPPPAPPPAAQAIHIHLPPQGKVIKTPIRDPANGMVTQIIETPEPDDGP